MKQLFRLFDIPIKIMLIIVNQATLEGFALFFPILFSIIHLVKTHAVFWMYPLFILVSGIISILMFNLVLKIDDFLEDINHFWLRVYRMNKNMYSKDKIDPEYYADGILSKRRKEYEDYLKKVREKRKEPKEKIPTLFDLEFKDELKFFNLYNIDFTFNDLKRVKRELVKQHHPDQFNDSNEKEMHRDLYEKTIKYYKTIVDAKKF
jgi:hypothetical protein